MMQVEEKTSLLAEFARNIERHFPETVWRSLYEERTGKAEFGSAKRTLLCVECPEEGPITRHGVVAALNRVAPQLQGLVDPCPGEFAFASFHDPRSAMQTAVRLHQMMPKARLRMGLGTGRCRIALCKAAGADFLMLLGAERARIEALAARGSPGTTQIAPEAYMELEEWLQHELGSCVVMAEYEGDELSEVSVTLPPDRGAELSTFAGLGLT